MATRSITGDALALCRKGFIAAGLFSLGVNVLMLTAPLYMLQVFDSVLASRSFDTLLLLTMVAGGALVTMGALEAVRGLLLARLGGWLDDELGPSVLRSGVEGAAQSGAAASVDGLRDLATLRSFLSGSAVVPLMDAPWMPIFLVVIFLLHPALGWLALGGALILFVMAVLNEVITRRLFQRAAEGAQVSQEYAASAARNADAIQAMGMLDNLIGLWRERHGETSAQLSRAAGRSSVITAVSKFLRFFLQIVLMGTGVFFVINNQLSPGGMIAASVLMGRALAPIDQSIIGWRSFVNARGAYRRLKERLQMRALNQTETDLPRPKGAVSAEAVSFFHAGTDKPAIAHLSFELDPGEAMGLVGPTAAGKTTLARLIVGNLPPRAGKVRLDGVNLAAWNAQDRGQYVGYLPQTGELFSGTVMDNIRRLGDGTPEAVMEAARIAGVHELILRLPKAYDTDIGPAGAALSGGQRQRIALARAVYGNPSLIVLDEPNASLDESGDAALLAAIATMKQKGATIIVISHRPHVMRLMDKILFLTEGKTAMFGPRDEVLRKLTAAAVPAQPAAAAPIAGEQQKAT